MAWIPSHQELRDHPKTRRAARMAGVSVPTMIGHLHVLWYWALDHAADGDLSRYEPVDLADAAMWEGDPDLFIEALTDCGPGTDAGFIADGSLHDWEEYGGRYRKRSEAGRKAAAVRWHSDDDANALAPASESQGLANTERELDLEEKEKTIPLTPIPSNGSSAHADGGWWPHFDDWWQVYPRRVGKAEAKKVYERVVTKGPVGERPTPEDLLDATRAHLVAWGAEPRPMDKIPYPATWLNRRSWEDEIPEPAAADVSWGKER